MKRILKKVIKESLKLVVPQNAILYSRGVRECAKRYDVSLLDSLRRYQLVQGNHHLTPVAQMVDAQTKCYEKLRLDIAGDYVYPYDCWTQISTPKGKSWITSITVDYQVVLESTLKAIETEIDSCSNPTFKSDELLMVKALRTLNARILDMLADRKDERGTVLTSYHREMLDSKPCSFDEALEKLLFYNGLFWQARHYHNGLGRLDMILDTYYQQDLANGKETRQSIKEKLKTFVEILGKDIHAKSLSLIGDTGQYILLGGIDKEGNTIQNDLTEIFLEIFTEMKVPDPKLILRVNKDTNDAVWAKAVDCIVTGCGSPLLMNEKLIMNGMIEFGYDKEDVWNVGTSACWEPLIIGKSFDQNNPLPSIIVVNALTEVINSCKDALDFDFLLEATKKVISQQIKDTVCDLDFCPSPLYSLFFDDCIKRGKDYAEGGGKYAYHGVQVCSLPNLVNSLLNVKSYVFEQKLLTLEQCRDALASNFVGHDDIRKLLLANPLKFGSADAQVVELTNGLMDYIGKEVGNYTINGERVKVGFSSPQYIVAGKMTKASLDGRYDYDPFAVHISPMSSKIDIQEVIDFAGSLHYSGNRLNGNVVDFILPTAYVKQQDKLVTILKSAMTSGVYELQLNVLDAKTLRDAKDHPEKYPHLVVRVWGFSAYFNDLPEEYKDNLIKRAEEYAA